MKKTGIIILLAWLALLQPKAAHAQLIEIITGAVKKAIQAIDLKIQREQNRVIWLQNAQKVMENNMAKLKLSEISDWSEKQRRLYDDYFLELRKVKNAIATYRRVREIINLQVTLVNEYRHAWGMLRQDDHFSRREQDQMYRVYSSILEESLKNIDQLMLVTNSFATQMSDGKRLELIEQAGRNIEGNLLDLRRFNNSNFMLSVGRAGSIREAKILRQVYGLQ